MESTKFISTTLIYNKNMEKKKKIILIVILILIIAVIIGALIFNPPERVRGGLRGGPIGPNQSAYLEEYQCFGFKRDFCPSWPDYGCYYLCYGITYDKKCFMETYTINGLQRVPSECK